MSASLSTLATFVCLARQALGPVAQRPRLLDVGTAFGFLVALADSIGWHATGVEPAGIGRLGGSILGVPVLNSLLQEANLPPAAFEVVVCSEVIEHVTDPSGFLGDVVRYLQPDGVLLLTTPNGEVVRGGSAADREWLEGLGAGHHLNLLSPRALTTLLHEHGLQDIRLFFHAGSSGRLGIVALAARRPGRLPDRLDWDVACREARDVEERYLRQLVVERERAGNHDVLLQGALFRLVQALVCRGEYTDAARYIGTLDELLRADGIDVATMASDGGEGPAFLGLYAYYRGMLQTNYLGDNPAAASSFGAAARLCTVDGRRPGQWQAGWFERAKLHEGLAQLRAGRHADAIATFDALLDGRDQVPDDVVDPLHQHKIMAHLELGDYEGIRRFVTRMSARDHGDPGGVLTASPPIAELDQARRELQEMAALYRDDRAALLRLNRLFDLLRGPRRALARVLSLAKPGVP